MTSNPDWPGDELDESPVPMTRPGAGEFARRMDRQAEALATHRRVRQSQPNFRLWSGLVLTLSALGLAARFAWGADAASFLYATALACVALFVVLLTRWQHRMSAASEELDRHTRALSDPL